MDFILYSQIKYIFVLFVFLRKLKNIYNNSIYLKILFLGYYQMHFYSFCTLPNLGILGIYSIYHTFLSLWFFFFHSSGLNFRFWRHFFTQFCDRRLVTLYEKNNPGSKPYHVYRIPLTHYLSIRFIFDPHSGSST